jgi:signal transduction histidine kinase
MRQRLLDDARHRVDSAVIAGHQAESARIAGQIHDDQVQAMTLASIRLQQLRRRAGDDVELAELVGSAQEATNGAIARLRRMIFELHSPVLESDGLEAAIETYLDETFGDDVDWSVHGDPGDLPSGTAGLAYRLAREAMFNTFKHASATSVDVELERRPGDLTVVIRDDGVGFDPADSGTERGHLGFDHSRQLAAAAGGSWSCSSRPGDGTTVQFVLPIGAAAE